MKCDCLYYSKLSLAVAPIKTNKQQAFTGYIPDALTHVNIGSKPAGYIGKIKVRMAQGGEAVLNVFKKYTSKDRENYLVINDYNEIIGEMEIAIKKFTDYNKYICQADPSHVYVDTLRNFSKPGTPYYKKGLTYHKDIGTRLLQIAQRRSDEAQCCGNLKLISKNESKDWYINIIGMREENQIPIQGKFLQNRNLLYLPPDKKELLSRIQGGL